MRHDIFASLEDLDHVCMRLQFDWEPISSKARLIKAGIELEVIGSKKAD